MDSPHHQPPFIIRPTNQRILALHIRHEVELLEEDFIPFSLLQNHLAQHAPVTLLVDRSHPYAYSAAVLQRILRLPRLAALAFLVQTTRQSERLSQGLQESATPFSLPVSIFQTKPEAITWLMSMAPRAVKPGVV